jgi:Transposase DDE domain
MPGHGNHLGTTAGCKIDICFDLLSGQTITIDLHTATTPDRTIGWDILRHVEQNDLILRDMGYFTIETFHLIEQKKAFWLSRLPRNVQANTTAGVSLETILQQSKTETSDQPMNIGKETQHPARLIAKKCTLKELRKNRKALRESYSKHGKIPTKAQLTRCDWHLMVTNIPLEKQSSYELHELYRQRWQIELAFRGWKKSNNLKQLHKHRTSSTHLKVLILTSMILLSLTLQFAHHQQQELSIEKQKQFSMEKLFAYISKVIAKIRNLYEIAHQNLDDRTIISQKRSRKSLVNKQVSTLA